MQQVMPFIPVQPEFNQKTRNYIEQKETNGFFGVLYYQFETDSKSTSLFSVVPDGCVDILFCRSKLLSKATIYGSRLQQSVITLQKNALYFGVRLIPCERIKSPLHSMKELVNQDFDLQDWLAESQTSELEKIIYEEHFQQKIFLFKRFFAALPSHSSAQILVDYVIRKIYSSKGTLNLEMLAQETGYTSRYVRKQFEQHVGMSPKLFCKITRFQHALSMLIDRQSPRDVLKNNSYYDQAQMINEFKRFGNTTPQQLFQALPFIS